MLFSIIKDWINNWPYQERKYWPSNVNLILDGNILRPHFVCNFSHLNRILNLLTLPDARALSGEDIIISDEDSIKLGNSLSELYINNHNCDIRILNNDRKWSFRPSSCVELRRLIRKFHNI